MNESEAIVAAYSMCWEGCFSITWTTKARRSKTYPYFIPSVSIAGTDKQLLDTFCSLTGYGKIYLERRTKPSTNQKAVYVWRLSGAGNMLSFCEEILPYLPAKKRQAELMIEFCKRRKSGQNVHDKTGYHSNYTYREVEIWEEMKLLNKRGVGKGYSDLKGVEEGGRGIEI